ncbi:MAG: sigma-70 family RNA polymerase sigma factor [Anaerolineales bacterium]
MLVRAQLLDEQALAEIYDRWSPALYRYALRLLGAKDLAEECVAETFSRFLVSLHQDRGPREFLQAYLFRISHNWMTDYYRSHRSALLPLDPAVRAACEDEPMQLSDLEAERGQVRAALSRLTPDQRQVVLLRFEEEWNSEMIAAALNKSEGAVKALQHRALESLRRMLLPSGMEES